MGWASFSGGYLGPERTVSHQLVGRAIIKVRFYPTERSQAQLKVAD